MNKQFRRERREVLIGAGMRVVARINYTGGDELFDWAAYVGKGETQDVADYGDKILPAQAAGYFPDLNVEKYRL